MSTSTAEREHFEAIVAHATSLLTGDEVLNAKLSGENSDFVRFNGEAVRQAGSVRQRRISIDLVDGRRHTGASLSLTEDLDVDKARVTEEIVDLRAQRSLVPEDPYLLFATDEASTERDDHTAVPDGAEAVDRVLDAAKGRDLVGIYQAGDSFEGYASTAGPSHWHRSASFNLDWSFYLREDKAAKNLYAGTTWDDDAFAAKVDWSARQLAALDKDPLDLEPGRYRTFLSPTALLDIVDWVSYGGFGLKAHRTKRTPLLRMVTEGATLHETVRISEDVAAGTAPAFQSQGFAKPDEVVLVDGGAYTGHLVSPRSAQEFGVETNGAEGHEMPVAVSVAPGDLPEEVVLDQLGTGLYVGNLWYLNFSDRAACRTTGMTRFATFWVDEGEIVAPVNVLRFDDTAYNLLGDKLVGLTDRAETILDSASYGARSTRSARLPGALVSEMTFTL